MSPHGLARRYSCVSWSCLSTSVVRRLTYVTLWTGQTLLSCYRGQYTRLRVLLKAGVFVQNR